MFECQTRDHEGATIQHETIDGAFKYANANSEVWKISWTNSETNERVRLIRKTFMVNSEYDPVQELTYWSYEPIVLPQTPK